METVWVLFILHGTYWVTLPADDTHYQNSKEWYEAVGKVMTGGIEGVKADKYACIQMDKSDADKLRLDK